jgi:hypothetical protein
MDDDNNDNPNCWNVPFCSASDDHDDLVAQEGPRNHLTLLLPAYNEELRIKKTLFDYTNFLVSYQQQSRPIQTEKEDDQRQQLFQEKKHQESKSHFLAAGHDYTFDILVVDDGSTDDTVNVVAECNQLLIQKQQQQQQQQQLPSSFSKSRIISIDCLSLSKNEGKGSAISRGLNYLNKHSKRRHGNIIHDTQIDGLSTRKTRGQRQNQRWLVLVADADGSGDIQCLHFMLTRLIHFLDSDASASSSRDSLEMAMLVGNRKSSLEATTSAGSTSDSSSVSSNSSSFSGTNFHLTFSTTSSPVQSQKPVSASIHPLQSVVKTSSSSRTITR